MDRRLGLSFINDDNTMTLLPKELEGMTADQICDTFLFSEEVYVQDGLRNLSEQFEARLRNHNLENCSILSDIEINSVFLNIGSIYIVNSRLYKELLGARLAGNLSDRCGRIMTSMIPFFKLYANYINSQKAASVQLAALRKRKSRFNEFIAISERCTGGHRVNKLMECPIYRLPQYLVFLAALYTKLDMSSTPSREVKNAIVAIREVTDHISSKLKDDAQRRLVVRFQEKMFKGAIDLVSPSRLVLKYGELNKMYHSQSLMHKKPSQLYMFVLCSDLLLYSSIRTPVHNAKVKHVLSLNEMAVKDIPERDNNPIHNAFFIVSATKPLTLYARTYEDKLAWMAAIGSAIDSWKLVQSELAGQPVPADGKEFEKMILKKKYRTVIHKSTGKRQRRVQSMIEMESLQDNSPSPSRRPMPVRPSRPTRPPPPPLSPSESIFVEAILPAPAPMVAVQARRQAPSLSKPIAPPVDLSSALPIPPAPPLPRLDGQIRRMTPRRSSAPDRPQSRRAESDESLPPPPPPPLPNNSPPANENILFLKEIRAGRTLRPVVSADRPPIVRTDDFEAALNMHAQLQTSLERYREFVQHDDDSETSSNGWDI